ncbi:hypothetical protein [Kineococcus arenarius]|uniref:hypothetical protein n=1 Tax=unclassified Kineococcus TaxID=2621656 RepID=UPI003D7CB4EB
MSDTEYEQALTAERDCVTAAGYEPSDLSWDDGRPGFPVTADEDEADPDAADEAFPAATDRCRDEHGTLVATVWAAED